MGLLTRFGSKSRNERYWKKRVAQEQARPISARMVELFQAEQQAWISFSAKEDKNEFLTKLGVTALDALPSAWPDGTELTAEALDVCTGVTLAAKTAVGQFGAGKMSEDEIKQVILTALRILSGLCVWNQPLCYTRITLDWTDETIKFLRERSLDKVAEPFQKGQNLVIRCHETMGHTLII